jgi:GNAT superfamily N-acetyltransferase
VSKFTFKPLTPERWKDFETLFGANGACGGCWCMAWRWQPKEFRQKKGDGAKRAFKKIVNGSVPPGLLAYAGKEAVGWVAIGPRTDYERLAGSKVLAPVDDQPVWCVPCFFIRKDYRNQGLSTELLKAAAVFAKRHKAKVVEGYPYDVEKKLPVVFVWTGLLGTYTKAGFKEVARRSDQRPIMRLSL